jgi:hypothetical protein
MLDAHLGSLCIPFDAIAAFSLGMVAGFSIAFLFKELPSSYPPSPFFVIPIYSASMSLFFLSLSPSPFPQ